MSAAEPTSGLLGQCPPLSARLSLGLVCPHLTKGPKASPLPSWSLSFPIYSSWDLDFILSQDLTTLVYSEEGAAYGKGREPGLGQRWGSEEGSLVVQMVKCLCAVQETQVRSLGWEDPLEKEMAPLSSTLAWKIPWMEEPGRLQSMGL